MRCDEPRLVWTMLAITHPVLTVLKNKKILKLASGAAGRVPALAAHLLSWRRRHPCAPRPGKEAVAVRIFREPSCCGRLRRRGQKAVAVAAATVRRHPLLSTC
jgi:hypothetical protein